MVFIAVIATLAAVKAQYFAYEITSIDVYTVLNEPLCILNKLERGLNYEKS